MVACSDQVFVPAGSQVTVTGFYREYASVQVSVDGKTQSGYLPKAVFVSLPVDVGELSLEQVEWKPVVDYSHWSYYSPENGGSIIASPLREEESDWVNDTIHHPVRPPLKIHFGLESTSTRWATVRIMGSPESTTDQWWENIVRMDIFVADDSYYIGIRDGSSENFNAQFDLPIPENQAITLEFMDPNGKQLRVLNDAGVQVLDVDLTAVSGLNLPDGMFPNGWFQFGTSVGPPGTLIVTQLAITSPPSGVVEKNWLSEPGLAELAEPLGIMIGTEFQPELMMDGRYCPVVRHDFNLAYLSPFSDARLWLAPGEYNFTVLDQVVNDTANLGLKIYASHLVWGATEAGSLPDWLKNGNYTREELLAILEQHITTLVSRYKDKVNFWSIANEFPERDISHGWDFWYDHIGPEYIEKSLQWARQADPDGILILNAANNESPRDYDTTGNIERMYQKVKMLKEKGVPVDAVGIQMHLFLPWTSPIPPVKEDVIATMQKFGSLGVKVMITEMDVNLHGMPGTLEEKVKLQTQLYGDMMYACIESGVCIAFSTWGVSDSLSWITCDYDWCVYKGAMPDAAPLMFDESYQPKPAYYAVRDALLEAAK